ncbi:hypothetical protein [Rhizobium sp. CFBP 8752]|nr:hypothetical protein [Rhizobium sp. CFBP 8752]MBD8664277.1 hypothetical protein [Rhizobium sp. CFBP 8752]
MATKISSFLNRQERSIDFVFIVIFHRPLGQFSRMSDDITDLDHPHATP